MLRKVLLLISMMPVLYACSTGSVSNYSSFAKHFGSEHAIQSNVDGWYQIPVRLARNADIERPFVAQARTARAPLYHQLVDNRSNQRGVPPLYCDYVFTFDREDRLRSVAVRNASCSQDPI